MKGSMMVFLNSSGCDNLADKPKDEKEEKRVFSAEDEEELRKYIFKQKSYPDVFYRTALCGVMELAAECMTVAMIEDENRAEIGASVYDTYFDPLLSDREKCDAIKERISKPWDDMIKMRKDRGETPAQWIARPKKVTDNDWFWHHTPFDETLSKEEKAALVMKLFVE